MGKINWARVVLGGVLWYLVFSVVLAIAFPLFMGEFRRAFEELNRPFQVTPAWVAVGIALMLVGGIFSIWFYAAIRPRYGPGPKTAACAGFALWLIGNLAPTVWWGWHLLQLPTGLVTAWVVTHLVAFAAATLVGAWPYKE